MLAQHFPLVRGVGGRRINSFLAWTGDEQGFQEEERLRNPSRVPNGTLSPWMSFSRLKFWLLFPTEDIFMSRNKSSLLKMLYKQTFPRNQRFQSWAVLLHFFLSKGCLRNKHSWGYTCRANPGPEPASQWAQTTHDNLPIKYVLQVRKLEHLTLWWRMRERVADKAALKTQGNGPWSQANLGEWPPLSFLPVLSFPRTS